MELFNESDEQSDKPTIINNKNLTSFITILDQSSQPPIISEKSDKDLNDNINKHACHKIIDGIESTKPQLNKMKSSYEGTSSNSEQLVDDINKIIQEDMDELKLHFDANEENCKSQRQTKYHTEIVNNEKIYQNKTIPIEMSGISNAARPRTKRKTIQTLIDKTEFLHENSSLPKVYNTDHYLSDFELDVKSVQIKDHNTVIPDVYRKPASTDLYEKLLVQLEMNDSYICFQKLMNPPNLIRDPTNSRNRKVQKKNQNCRTVLLTDMKKKFNNSLWFSQQYLVRGKGSQRNSIKRKHLLKTKNTIIVAKDGRTKCVSSCNGIKINAQNSSHIGMNLSDTKKTIFGSKESINSLTNYKKIKKHNQYPSITTLTDFSDKSSKCIIHSSRRRENVSRHSTGTIRTSSDICSIGKR